MNVVDRPLPAPRPAPRRGFGARLPGLDPHHAVADAAEIEAVLAADPAASRLTHVATPRTVADIVHARARGVARFAVGAKADLDDVTRHAPRAQVLVRVTPEGRATSGESALRLLRRAVSHGHTVGVRLRLGERLTDARAWNDTLRAVSRLRWHLECDDQDLRTVDLGRLPGDAELVRFVARSTDLHLGPDLPRVLFESELSHRRRPRR